MSHRAVPWRDDLRELFEDFVPADWTPPRAIRTWVNAARDKATFQARFRRPDGHVVTCTVKGERDASGAWWQTETHLDLRMVFQNLKPGEALDVA